MTTPRVARRTSGASRITKAGNGRARRVLIEGAWSYRFPARVTGENSGPSRRRAGGGADDRVEGATPAVRPVPASRGDGQELERGRNGDRPRDGGLRLGDRAQGRAYGCCHLSRSLPRTISEED